MSTEDNDRELPGRTYKVQIDKSQYEFDEPIVSGRILLEKAGKTPVQGYAIYFKDRSGPPERITDIDAPIDLADPGREKFVTLPLDQTEGLGLRRDFVLPEDDRSWLEACGLSYELVADGGSLRVVLYGVPTQPGYNYDRVAVNVRIEAGYPDSQIDMAYVHPPLARIDGRTISAICPDSFDGKVWQRWSRHRTGANPWRPGVDNLATHFALVDTWFARELTKA